MNLFIAETNHLIDSREGWRRSGIQHPPPHEVAAYKHMIQAISSQHLSIAYINDLESLVKLADFYGASPVVSIALDGVMLRTPNALVHSIRIMSPYT